jgi:hypothetical protein
MELVLEMVVEVGLDMMGEDDNKDEDNSGEWDVAGPTATTALAASTPELVVEEEEDSKMLILE